MGELIDLNPPNATGTETVIAAHVSALHPFPIFGFGDGVSTENVFNSGSGFLDCRGGGGTFPPGMGHIQGFQAKFNNLSGNWGMQLVTQNNIDNECYFRIVNWNEWKPWRRIWNDGNFNPAKYLQISEGDTRYRQTAVALTDADIPSGIARDAEIATAIASHVAVQHSVLCTLFSTVVAAVGLETVISFSPIAAAKIVNISAQIVENLGASGLRYILKAGGGDFSPTPFLRFGAIRIPAVTASQLVGLPLHILVWHIA